MDFNALSDEELADSLRTTMRSLSGDVESLDRMQATLQALQVHRVELEMQNRALRETQIELEHALQRYSDLYDHLPIGYMTFTPQGRITEANLTAAEWLKGDRAALVGDHLRSFLNPFDAGRFAVHLEECAKGGEPASLELKLQIDAGTSRLVQLSSLRDATHAPGILIRTAFTDVSGLKQAQRVLEEVNREQEAFNHSISHDLRAPLVTIANFARIVLAEHNTAFDPEGAAMVQRIEAAAVRMENTLRRLLEYSNLTRNDIELHAIDLDEIMRDLLVEYRGVIQERKAEVAVESPLPCVRGSRAILAQALGNLLTNAIKYTAPGEAPRVRISAVRSDRHVSIKVADQGIGIAPKDHERIFRMFERLHGQNAYPGSGVGLAIVRRGVERLGGRVWVESGPGQGSCFHVELPPA